MNDWQFHDHFFRRVNEFEFLRFIAIVAVVSTHIFNIAGGFIGVDIFFVISGYVITLSILKANRINRFSLTTFYHYRIRRIIPPLIMVSILSFIPALYFFIVEKDFIFISESYFYQAFFLQNFYFTQQSTDYFQGPTQAKLNLHLWSLAVEEQFYIFIPAIFLLFNPLKKTRPLILLFTNFFLLSLLITIGFLSVPDILTNIELSKTQILYNPTLLHNNYFLIYPRIWQLLSGVIMALFAFRWGNLSFVQTALTNVFLRRSISLVCLLIIFYSITTVDPNMNWPRASSILPVFSTAILLFILHLQTDPTLSKIFNFKIFYYIGKSSYSIYLYHWPIYALLLYINSSFTTFYLNTAIYLALLFLFSFFSYQIFEKNRASITKTMSLLLLVFYVGAHIIMSTISIAPETRSGEIQQILQTAKPVKAIKSNLSIPSGEFIILWGDSHAEILFNVVADFCKNNNLSLIYISSMPLVSEHKHTALVEAAIKSNRLKGIVLAGRWSFYMYLTEDEIDEKVPHYLHIDGKTPDNLSEAMIIFDQALKKYLNHFGLIKTIVFTEAPRYPFYPPKEALLEALGVKNRQLPQKTITQHQAEQKNTINLLTNNFHPLKNFRLFEWATYLCHQQYCQWRDGNNLFYMDDDHLSDYGVRHFQNNIFEQLKFFLE